MAQIGKKEKSMKQYESPSIEIIEVVVGLGFTESISGDMGESGNMAGGGNLNVNW